MNEIFSNLYRKESKTGIARKKKKEMMNDTHSQWQDRWKEGALIISSKFA